MLERCYDSRLNVGGLGTRGRVDEVNGPKLWRRLDVLKSDQIELQI